MPTTKEATVVTKIGQLAVRRSILVNAAPERVWQEFQSLDPRPASRNGPGTGLGLAIVRALVIAHGGSVWYENTPGGGATFVCTFPLEPK